MIVVAPGPCGYSLMTLAVVLSSILSAVTPCSTAAHLSGCYGDQRRDARFSWQQAVVLGKQCRLLHRLPGPRCIVEPASSMVTLTPSGVAPLYKNFLAPHFFWCYTFSLGGEPDCLRTNSACVCAWFEWCV